MGRLRPNKAGGVRSLGTGAQGELGRWRPLAGMPGSISGSMLCARRVALLHKHTNNLTLECGPETTSRPPNPRIPSEYSGFLATSVSALVPLIGFRRVGVFGMENLHASLEARGAHHTLPCRSERTP